MTARVFEIEGVADVVVDAVAVVAVVAVDAFVLQNVVTTTESVDYWLKSLKIWLRQKHQMVDATSKLVVQLLLV